MSAPKLLDKKTINAEVATQQKQKIIEGITLSKKVDKVRGTLNEEETRLERFRTETIRKVQQEIDAKVLERDSLENGNQALRRERVQLETPIDLSQAWAEVKEEEKKVQEWTVNLTQQQIEQNIITADNESQTKRLVRMERNIERRDILSEKTLIEAECKLDEASQEVVRTKQQAQKMLANAEQKEKESVEFAQQLIQREKMLRLREKANQTHEIDLSNRERKLRVNEQVFIKAQQYLKDKKKKKL